MSFAVGNGFSPAAASAGLLAALNQALGVTVAELSADSRRVQPGVTFAAFPGERSDGRDYIPQALQAGANAVLWEARDFAWRTEWQRPNLGVNNLREWVGPIAGELYGRPSSALQVFGVTGTNGKTSCSQWLAQCLDAAGKKCAVIGTIGNGFLGALQSSTNTTPDPIGLQATLAQLRRDGARAVSMEVSSHGLEQARVNGVHFDVALFTNLSRDHLDYHGDMSSYFAAKAKLFAAPDLRAAVINLDDVYGLKLLEQLRKRELRVYGYGWRTSEGQPTAPNLTLVQGEQLQVTPQGVRFNVRTSGELARVNAAVLGAFNAHNLLGVIACLLAADFPLREAVRLASAARPVPGRMQCVGGGEQPVAVVDYAHSPDALEKVLSALRESLPVGARLIAVFGCGGERDRGKRSLMGSVASRLADLSVITSDNPRGEQPLAIIDEILQGVSVDAAYQVEADRARAIDFALNRARGGDIVLIAGKGHEDYQESAGRRVPFSDIEHARAALQTWRGAPEQ